MKMRTIPFVLLACALKVSAQTDTLADYTLKETVVSANRWTQEKDLQPMRIEQLTFEQANAYNPQTAADVLGLTGAVFVQKSQYGGGSPMIRGFSTHRLLYSVDGVRMNTAIFRAGNLQNVISLDPFSMTHTEVLFGPGSVSYGSDAVGGVMAFSTLRPQLTTQAEPLVTASATLRTATASDEFTAHLHAGVGWRNWGFLTSLTTSSFGDLKQGTHGPEDYVRRYIVVPGIPTNEGMSDEVKANNNVRRQSPSGYSQFNLMQKFRFMPNERWNLEYAFHWSETSEYARYDRHLRMRGGLPRYAEWNYGPQKWMMNHLRADHASQSAIYDSLRLNVAWQRFEESRISRDLGKPQRETQAERVDAWSVSADFLKRLLENLSFSYGAEWVKNEVYSHGTGCNLLNDSTFTIVSRYPRATWQSAGIFAQTEWTMTPSLILSAGLRYNHYFIRNNFSTAGYELPYDALQKSDAGSVSGQVGVNWRIPRGWMLRANYARGFRAPNVDDMGKLFDSVDGCVTVPNPMLQPEYANHVEVGVAQSKGRKWNWNLTAYYTHLNNAIVRRDATFNGSATMIYQGEECRVQMLENAAKAEVWGVQAAAKARFAKYFYADGHLNWQRGFEETDDGRTSPSRHVAPLFGRAALGFECKAFTMEAFAAFQAKREADDMPEEEKGKTEIYALDAQGRAYAPGWWTLNLRIGVDVWSDCRLHATLENITDRRYRPYASGISAPGRNLTLSATWNL